MSEFRAFLGILFKASIYVDNEKKLCYSVITVKGTTTKINNKDLWLMFKKLEK